MAPTMRRSVVPQRRGLCGGATGFGWGSLAIAGACLAWGIDNNLTRKVSLADARHIAVPPM